MDVTQPGREGTADGWWPPRGRAADALVAVAVGVFVLVGTQVEPLAGGGGKMSALSWTLAVVASAALYLRRRHPVLVAVVTLVACALYYPLTEPDGPVLVTFVVALFTTAAEGYLIAAVTLGVVSLLAIGFGEIGPGPRHVDDTAIFMFAGWIVAVIAAGVVTQARRAYLQAVEQRLADIERSKEVEASRRATEERLRIARELHDVLGHNISLINVQAGAALHRLDKEPAAEDGPVGAARSALSAIKGSSGEALRELRTTLGVLRQVDEDAPTAPPPGVAGLSDLARKAGTGGLTVRVEVPDPPLDLPPEVDLAAYRIAQEALTNVTRHAGAATAVVTVRREGQDVLVEITDDGRGTDGTAEPGNGIRGMGERARALGGELTAADRAEGGFGVHARLPLREAR